MPLAIITQIRLMIANGVELLVTEIRTYPYVFIYTSIHIHLSFIDIFPFFLADTLTAKWSLAEFSCSWEYSVEASTQSWEKRIL